MNKNILNKNVLLYCGIIILIYLLYFHNLGSYELLDVDETRYVDMAKNMFKTKEFLTLYLNGEYFFEKPPLYFWIENISFYLFRTINEITARIPCVLEGILCGGFLFFTINKATKDKNFALVSSLVLLSSAEFIILSKIAIIDILLTCCLCLSILCGFLTFFSSKKDKKLYWWGFYIFCGLAILAKGLPGLIIPFAIMFFIGIYTKKIKEYFKVQYFLIGIVLFLLIILPWHIIMFKTHTSLFFNEYIIKHHLVRFIGGQIIHRDAPFWFYFPVILWGILPYSASFIAMFIKHIKKGIKFLSKKPDKKTILKKIKENIDYQTKTPKQKFIALSIIAALTIFLFFESSKTKLITYILPIYPFLAVLIGNFWLNYIKEGKNKKYIEYSSIVFNYLIILAGLIAAIVLYFIPQPLKNDLIAAYSPSLFFALLFPTIALVAIKKGKRLVLFLSYLIMMVCISAFSFHEFLRMDYNFGQYDLIKYAKYAKEKNLNIYTYQTGARYSLLYYSDKKAQFDIKKSQVKHVLKNKLNLIIVRKKHLKEITNKYRIIDIGRKYILITK